MQDIAKLIHTFGTNTSDYMALIDFSLRIIWLNTNYKDKGLKKGKLDKNSGIDISLVKKALKENKKQSEGNTKVIPVEFSDKRYVIVIEHEVINEKYSEILDNMLDIITIIDSKGKILYETPSVKKLLGYEPEELIGRSVFKYLHKEDLLKAKNLLKQVIKDPKKEVHSIMRYKHKNGSWLWLEFVGKIIFKDGKVESVIINSREVTERKKAQESLKKNQEMLIYTGEMAKVGGWEIDIKTKEVKWTDETYKIHEVPIGAKIKLSYAINFFHEKDRPKLKKAIKKAIEKGESYDLVLRFITANGKNLWTHTMGMAEKEKGKVVKIIGTFQDITELKEKESKLTKNKRLLEEVFEKLPVGLWFADKKGKLERGNPKGKEIWGAEPKVGVKEYGVFKAKTYPEGKQLKPKDWALYKTVTEGKTIEDELLEIEAFDNKKKIIQNYTFPVLDENKKVEKAIVVNIDVTDLKRKEEELKESEEKFRKTVMNSPYPIMIHAEDGEVILINKIWEKLTGYGQKEISTISKWTKKAYGKNMSVVKKVIDNLYTKKEISHQGEFVIKIKSGKKMIWEFSSAPLGKLPDGRRQIMSIAKDITKIKKAEKALKKSKRKYMSLAENSPDTIMRFDRKLRHIYVNSNVEKQTGIKKEKFVGKTHEELGFPKEMCELWRNALKKVFNTRKPNRIEFKLPNNIWIDWYLVPELYEKKVSSVITFARDITELKNTELRLKQNEEKLNSIIEHSSNVYYMHDTNNRIIYISPQCKRFFGYSQEEMKIKWTDIATKNPLNKKALELTKKAIKTGKRQKPYLSELKRKDGSLVIVEANESPLKDEKGKVIGISGSLRDVTLQYKSNKILEENEKRYSLALESTGQLVYDYDIVSGNIVWKGDIKSNTGYSEKEFNPDINEWEKMINPKDRERATKVLDESMKQNKPYEITYRFKQKDGSYKYVQDHGQFINDEKGKPYRMIGTMKDITFRKNIEKEKQQLNEKLMQRVEELEKFQRLTIGRELRMVELKNKIKELEKKLKNEKK